MNTGSRAEARSGQWMLDTSGGIGVAVGVGEGISVGDGVNVRVRVGPGVGVETGVARAQDAKNVRRMPRKTQTANGRQCGVRRSYGIEI
jgi:hypothetical protein